MSIKFTKDGVELTGSEWNELKRAIETEIVEIVTKIEEEFGPRDESYTLTIVNFNKENAIVTTVDERSKSITIHLPSYEMNEDEHNLVQRTFNLSHELIHTITPGGDPAKVINLEEGLASVFSWEYTKRKFIPAPKYLEAHDLVQILIAKDRDIIKKLRAKYQNKRVSEYTMLDILGELHPADRILSEVLAKPFNSV